MRKLNSQNLFLKQVKRYISGKVNPKEEIFLENYYNHFENRPFPSLPEEELDAMKMEMKGVIWAKVLLNQKVPDNNGVLIYISKNLKKNLAVAAIFLGLVIVSSIWLLRKDGGLKIATKAKIHVNRNQNIISPGSDKAILTLSDGSSIMLDSTENRILTDPNNTIISNKKGKIVYKKNIVNEAIVAFNKISTPKGGMYQVVLSDKTKVWLNASSSLYYPVTFKGKERIVELTGEAYFEVATMKGQPFIVKVKDVNVKVLGTHFNIMSYNDEDKIATTLLEGSIYITKGNESKFIKPGQQMRYYANGKNEINDNVDIEQVIAWKNNKFHFEDADIRTIMRQLSRWYNINVSYEGIIPESTFGGIIGRKESINQLLKAFELTGKIHFKIEGTKIKVTH